MSVDGNQKFFIFLFLVECIWAKSGEVCFPFGSTEPNVNPPQTAVGRPGKTGPRGPPGIGERGPPGACACNPNEIEQLREEIQLQEGKQYLNALHVFFYLVAFARLKLKIKRKAATLASRTNFREKQKVIFGALLKIIA